MNFYLGVLGVVGIVGGYSSLFVDEIIFILHSGVICDDWLCVVYSFSFLGVVDVDAFVDVVFFCVVLCCFVLLRRYLFFFFLCVFFLFPLPMIFPISRSIVCRRLRSGCYCNLLLL